MFTGTLQHVFPICLLSAFIGYLERPCRTENIYLQPLLIHFYEKTGLLFQMHAYKYVPGR